MKSPANMKMRVGIGLAFLVAMTTGVLWYTAARADSFKHKQLSEELRHILDTGEHFTILSLDPKDADIPGAEPPKGEAFHGYAVLGKAEIREAKERKELLADLYKGIAQSDGRVAACFRPRHGIHAVLGDKTVDLVICFQCLSIKTYLKDEQGVGFPTTDYARQAFDRAVEKAGLPVAKDR